MSKQIKSRTFIPVLVFLMLMWTVAPAVPTVFANEDSTPPVTESETPTTTEPTEPAGEVDITTGDATGVSDVDNRVNVNDNEVDTGSGDCSGDCGDPIATDDSYESENSLVVTNDNEANVDNEVNADGNSGGNEAVDNNADINISTGMVQIISNIFNLINVNFIGTGGQYLRRH